MPPDRFASTPLGRVLFDDRFIVIACSAIVAIAAIIKYVLHPVAWDGTHHASYNNFIIFRNSFLNLVQHRDLYGWHLEQQWDLYKYSPSFAVLMAPFAFLPVPVGLVLWSLLNTVPLIVAIRMLPLDATASRSIVYVVLVELVTSIQSAQSNGLVAALFLLSFVMLERRRLDLAALFAVLNVSIKLLGLAGFLLFLFYPRKWKAALWALAWLVLVAALPLLFVTPGELSAILVKWFQLLHEDTARANPMSVYGWLAVWFHFVPPRALVLAAGVVLLCLPLARVNLYAERSFRLLVLASLLIWVVIFNHKAESPTFIVAMCGVAIWFFASPPSLANRILLLIAFVFVSLSPTDIFPAIARHQVFGPYGVKAVPCIAIWFVLTARLLFGFRRPAPPVSPEP